MTDKHIFMRRMYVMQICVCLVILAGYSDATTEVVKVIISSSIYTPILLSI